MNTTGDTGILLSHVYEAVYYDCQEAMPWLVDDRFRIGMTYVVADVIAVVVGRQVEDHMETLIYSD